MQQQKRDLHARHQGRGPKLGTHGLPTQLGAKAPASSSTTTQQSQRDAIGVRRERGFAKWTASEKRSKFGGLSFAERYLKKHGFKGRLGKDEEGIANPVKPAPKRRNNEGLGFLEKDCAGRVQQPKNVQQELRDIEARTVRQKQELKERQALWRIVEDNTDAIDEDFTWTRHKKRKVEYRTPLQQAQSASGKMEIHDYTKAQVVLTTTDQISSRQSMDSDRYAGLCPAFQHNVARICDLIEVRGEVLQREGENLKQRQHTLGVQLDALRKQKAKQADRDKGTNALKCILDRLKADDVSLDGMWNVFSEVQSKFCAQYLKHRIWRLFPAEVFPKLKVQLTALGMCSEAGLALLKRWRPLMSNESVEQDVWQLFATQVLSPRIRKELYEWHPMEAAVNARFVALFASISGSQGQLIAKDSSGL